MSKVKTSKVAAVLISFSILLTTANFTFAENSSRLSPGGKPEATIGGANKILLMQQNIKNIEDRITGMREKLASKEAALRLKLQAFRDQKKATVAARISTNLNKINQNQTTQMQKHLDTMTSILDRLEARVNQPTPDIKNPADAKVAIASARAAIASAAALVATQAQKDYTIQVTTESRLRLDAQTMRNKLHTDILALRKAVIDAKQAVANAIRIAKSGPSVSPGPEKEGTQSGR